MFGMLALLVRVTAFGSVVLDPTVSVTLTERMFGRSVTATGDVSVPSTLFDASVNENATPFTAEDTSVRFDVGVDVSVAPRASGNEKYEELPETAVPSTSSR